MTPIFYHHDQDVVHDFISTMKVPEFVRQADRRCKHAHDISPAILTYAHDVEYVRDVVEMRIPDGFGKRHPDMVKYALGSCASFLSAVEHVMSRADPVACSASQGFHHAHYDHNYGYCTFNALAVASSKLIADGEVDTVLIIDGDGHRSDGTKDILDRTNLLGQVVVVDRDDLIELENSSIAGWCTYMGRLIERHRPGIILYQAGADAWEKDPYDAGYLSRLGLERRDKSVFWMARDASVPVVWNLAGGYSEPMQTVIDLHLHTLRISDEAYYGTTAPKKTDVLP